MPKFKFLMHGWLLFWKMVSEKKGRNASDITDTQNKSRKVKLVLPFRTRFSAGCLRMKKECLMNIYLKTNQKVQIESSPDETLKAA